MDRCEAVVIGTSWGGMAALPRVFAPLPPDLPVPVVVVQHLHPRQEGYYLEHFNRICPLPVKEAENMAPIRPGVISFAPANYHLLIEDDRTFLLSVDERVHHSRPSIDVLFESAVDVYGAGLIGVILTGANEDGAAGLARLKERGGITIVQDPATAEAPEMPRSAIQRVAVDYVLPLEEIGAQIKKLVGPGSGKRDKG